MAFWHFLFKVYLFTMFYNVSSGSGVVIAHYSYMQVYKYFIVDVCCLECLPSILLMIVFLLALETASSTGTGVPMFLETKTTGLCWLAQCEHWDLNSASQSPSSIFFFFNWNWKKNKKAHPFLSLTLWWVSYDTRTISMLPTVQEWPT